MRLTNLTISTRLAIGFTLVLVQLAAISLLGMFCLEQSDESLKSLADNSVTKLRYAQTMAESIHIISTESRSVLLSTNSEMIDASLQEVAAARERYAKAAAALASLPATEIGKLLLSKIASEKEADRPLNEKVFNLAKAKKTAEATAVLLQEAAPATKKLQSDISEYINRQIANGNEVAKEAGNTYHTGRNLMIAMSILALVIGSAASVMITRSIVLQLGGELGDAVGIASRIAGNDLAFMIPTRSGDKSSLLFALNTMRESLAKVVTEVRTGTDAIANASSEIAAGNLDLSSRTEQQASSLGETVASMEQLTDTVRQNADNAHKANQLAVAASDVAVRGGAVVSQVVETMGSINESAKKIVEIISVIDGIAFQTNILALNAAVEAARAGEQGRGFAVVAGEVRNLAQRSAAAAKEIKTLINDSVEKVDTGSRLVDKAGNTMQEIVNSVKHVTDIMGEITAATHEQTTGIEQINVAITQMDSVTQQNAALVEQAAAAAAALQNQADNLTHLVAVFHLENKGIQAVARPALANQREQPRPVPKTAPTFASASGKKTIGPLRTTTVATTAGEWEEF